MAGQSIVRLATVKDLDALVRLEKVGFTSDQFDRDQLLYLLSEANATALIIEQDGQVCGSAIMAWRKNSEVGRLYSIVIDPAFQGCGLGSQLLQACEDTALKRGCDRVSLEVRVDNKRAITMYERHGYAVTERLPEYYADGSAGLRMVKTVTKRRQSGIRLAVPYYAQTLEFTCGPACLMMAMKYHDPRMTLDRSLELILWKEATLIFMTSGLGGCGPFGLAVAAQRRGFQTRVILADQQTAFLASVRNQEKKDVIRLVDAQLREEAQALGVTQEYFNFTFEDIARALRQNTIPIVLISTYRLHRVKAPHWVVVTGFDRRNVYFHDPYEGFYTGQAQHVRIAIPEFRRLHRYGKAVNKSVIFVSRARKASEALLAAVKASQKTTQNPSSE
jgi:ribosomal protein S18 acetylase RimI-like enzyme/predicted double-glycine peptidase